MSTSIYDLAVIGAGSGGLAAARRAAERGRAVIVFEESEVGGTCVNTGCVPKKLLVHASRMADHLSEAPHLGWRKAAASFDWPALAKGVQDTVRKLSVFHRKRLEDLGVTVVDARAALAGPTTVEAGGRRFEAARILIATGAEPIRPPIPGADHGLVSDDIFTLPALPGRLAIIGGGYIAVEFACLMNRFGVEVTLYEQGSRLIGAFDPEIADRLLSSMRDEGIDITLQAEIGRINPSENGYRLTMKTGDDANEVDVVLLATGRRPRTDGLDLGRVGVETRADGRIATDEEGRTSVSTIFAVGDVADRLALTPVAVRSARRAVDALSGGEIALPPAETVPTAVFTTPECGAVGMTAREAEKAGYSVEARTASFIPLTGLLSPEPEHVFMKAVIDIDTGRLLGLHFFGPYASEAAQLGAVALGSRLTEEELHHAMPLHPTLGEEVLGLGRRDEPLHQRPANKAA